MLRVARAVLVACLVVAPIARGDDARPSDRDLLQGDWINESFVMNGGPLPEAKKVADRLCTFEGDTFRERRNGKIAVRCSYVLDPAKSPKTIDVTFIEGGPGEGETIRGIYTLERDTLTVCIGTPETDRPKTFESKPGSRLRLVVYKKKPK